MTEKVKTRGLQIVCGSSVGLANSLFGGGGGMLAVPLLQKIGLMEKRAHATAILLILPICVSSFLFYAYGGFFNAAIVIPTSLGVTAGGFLGAKLLGRLPEKTVSIVFAVLQAIAGLLLLFTR